MRLLIDMNLTPRWVKFLRTSGHDTAHWQSLGPASAKDREICQYAREHEYVVLTNDLDFPQILAYTRAAGPSIVLLRGEPLIPEVRGTALVNALVACESDLARGAIVTLDWSDQPRARVLPLR